jgi:hypothetical protein
MPRLKMIVLFGGNASLHIDVELLPDPNIRSEFRDNRYHLRTSSSTVPDLFSKRLANDVFPTSTPNAWTRIACFTAPFEEETPASWLPDDPRVHPRIWRNTPSLTSACPATSILSQLPTAGVPLVPYFPPSQ